jgi:hypothetical protein
MQREFQFNPLNLYRIIDGKKYQFSGLYPANDELLADLQHVHWKHGFVLKCEKESNDMKVWRRKI